LFVNKKQSTGAFIAVSRYASATMPPPSVISRGVGWQVNTHFISFILQIPSRGFLGASKWPFI